jgi:1-acyl-sn-glycerol-3-phosphate acyltransferase
MGERLLHSFMAGTLLHRTSDVLVTLCCWVYFIFGFVLIFSPFYCLALLFPARTEYYFQRLNSIFYKGFFALLRIIAPRLQWAIDPAIREIRSAVVICNHLSYLDPILLISLFERAKTVVKPVFFSVPVFGAVLTRAGYFPSTSTGPHRGLMITQMEAMAGFLEQGGNLFIFPQGTRRKDGTVGELNEGAIKIARFCKAPIYILCLRNTEKIFTPGQFFFHTGEPTQVTMRIMERFDAGVAGDWKVSELQQQVHAALASCLLASA